jgi:hypothetical protein
MLNIQLVTMLTHHVVYSGATLLYTMLNILLNTVLFPLLFAMLNILLYALM